MRHLLTMYSGIVWDEERPYTDPENSEIKMIFAPDSYRYAFEQPMTAEPGKVWNYNGGSTTLLAAIVEKVAVFGDDDLDSEFPERYTSVIEVDANGSTFRRRVPYAKGCPENPLQATELEAKFRRLTSEVMATGAAEQLIAAV